MAKQDKPTTKVKVLRVTARRESFRRCGRVFGALPTDIPLAALDKDEIATLKADKQLVVYETEIDAPAAEPEADAEGAEKK